MNKLTYLGQPKQFPERMKTIKVDVRTWDTLKSMKKEYESFNDVIKSLLMERTKDLGNTSIQAINYKRKIGFCQLAPFVYTKQDIGFEFEYNDIKSQKEDFVLDIKIRKVFFGKKIYNPSEFFGVDNAHKHYSRLFIEMYFIALGAALSKEFRILVHYKPTDIAYYRQLYYDYNLSEESFKADIEEPMRLSEDEKPSTQWKEKMKSSLAENIVEQELLEGIRKS